MSDLPTGDAVGRILAGDGWYVWAQRHATDRLEEPPEGSELRMRRGRVLEPLVIDWQGYTPGETVTCDRGAAQIDARDDGVITEVYTTAMFRWPSYRHAMPPVCKRGERLSGEVKRISRKGWQALWGAAVAAEPTAKVCVVELGPRGADAIEAAIGADAPEAVVDAILRAIGRVHVYDFSWSGDLADEMLDSMHAWWERHMIGGREPEAHRPVDVPRGAGDFRPAADLPPATDRQSDAWAQYREASDAADAAKARLEAVFDGAAGGVTADGWRHKWQRSTRKGAGRRFLRSYPPKED